MTTVTNASSVVTGNTKKLNTMTEKGNKNSNASSQPVHSPSPSIARSTATSTAFSSGSQDEQKAVVNPLNVVPEVEMKDIKKHELDRTYGKKGQNYM